MKNLSQKHTHTQSFHTSVHSESNVHEMFAFAYFYFPSYECNLCKNTVTVRVCIYPSHSHLSRFADHTVLLCSCRTTERFLVDSSQCYLHRKVSNLTTCRAYALTSPHQRHTVSSSCLACCHPERNLSVRVWCFVGVKPKS